MTGSLIIILIVAVTDVHFYFANKKQAQGLKIIEPVDGVDSSVSLLPLRTYRECRVTDLTSAGQIPIHLLGGKLGCMHGWEVVLLYLRDMKDSLWRKACVCVPILCSSGQLYEVRTYEYALRMCLWVSFHFRMPCPSDNE